MSKSFLPVRGTKDFLPSEMEVREKIREVILKTYQKYGFNQIKTPIIEDIDLLLGSEGGDNLKLIYKILKRGEKLNLETDNIDDLVDLGLRYDLTVPLARFYINNKEKLLPIFKSIQIDDVFRAERPQRGRSRQFTQCDIDIINDESVNSEIEIIYVAGQTLLNLGFKDFTFKISDRRLLNEILANIGFDRDSFADICISVDKLEKIGLEGVKTELIKKEYDNDKVTKLIGDLTNIKTKGINGLKELKLNDNVISEVETIVNNSNDLANGKYQVEFDINIIRGQGYYTASVFEVYLSGFDGASGGGGRYNDMIEKLNGFNVPAVGFSFGFERLFIIISENNLLMEKKEKLALIYEEDDFSEVVKLMEEYSAQFNVTTIKRRKNFGYQLTNLKENGYTKYVLFKEKIIENLG